ncbi:MAG: hypothetical protein IJE68_06400 [Clostridia bacterium]|nr:hypothetical protein [Clostridia bacterium]
MKNNKILIIIISIILVLAATGGVLAYLFIATDTFKSDQELFAKYFAPNIDAFEQIIDLKTIEIYQNLENETKYESSANVQTIHSEGGEVSNPLNNLSLKLNVQKDDEQEYFYADAQILYEDEEFLETEIIKEQEQYGIRFTDAFKQFVTINQDEDIESISNEIGIDGPILEMLIKIMNGNEGVISKEKINESKDKYLNIITTEISKGTFEKQKDAMITYNDVTTKTNAYSVSLTSEQVKKIWTEISNNVNEDTEVPAAKITVYEQKQQTIRTVIEIGENKITIENSEQDGKLKIKINYLNSSNEDVFECNTEINKDNLENQESFEIIANIINGEDTYTVNVLNQMKLIDNTIKVDLELSNKQDITTTSIKLENIMTKGNDFDKMQTLTPDNYRSLSSISDQTKRKQIIDSLKEIVAKVTTERIGQIIGKLGLQANEGEEMVEEIPQADINNFNAKFEFYTGEEVSAENIKTLLGIVKDNCSGHTIMSIEPTEEMENEEVEQKSIITLHIEEGATNDEAVTKVLEEINDNKKYKVLISYKESNGLIDYITITEI